jgi:hypothetical protein
MLHRCWTKHPGVYKTGLLHIPSCGYAGVFPQPRRISRLSGVVPPVFGPSAAAPVTAAASCSASSCFPCASSHAAPAWMRTPRHVLPVDKITCAQCRRTHSDETSASRVQHGMVVDCRVVTTTGCVAFFCRQMEDASCWRSSSNGPFAFSDLLRWRVRRRVCGQEQGTFFFADKTTLASCGPCRWSQRVRCRVDAALFTSKFLLFS